MSCFMSCLECGEVFGVPFASHARAYCSYGCREQNFPVVKCKLCGKEFKKKSARNVYCSKQCVQTVYSDPEIGIKYGRNNYFKTRFEVLKRDKFRCQYCGRNPQEDNCKLQVDHINPRANGGLNTVDNLITACSECNAGKRDILLEARVANKIKLGIKNGNA